MKNKQLKVIPSSQLDFFNSVFIFDLKTNTI
jgi:hypothetical protein